MVKSIFYGFGAWVGRIDSETRCAIWARNPLETSFDPILLLPIDLARTPSAAHAGKIGWDEIQVDDLKEDHDDGVTTLGPWFPDGKTIGAVYLAESYRRRLRDEIRPEWPPPEQPQRPYEYMTVVYGNEPGHERSGKRYHGYHAKIVSERGPSALVAVHHAGCSLSGDPVVEHTFVLDSADCDAHVDDGGLTEIGLGNKRKKEGALFIRLSRSRSVGINEIKKPPGHLSGFTFPSASGILSRKALADERVVVPGQDFRLRHPSGKRG